MNSAPHDDHPNDRPDHQAEPASEATPTMPDKEPGRLARFAAIVREAHAAGVPF